MAKAIKVLCCRPNMAGVDIGLQGDYEQGDVVERISTEAPCRKNQIELLLTLMGQVSL